MPYHINSQKYLQNHLMYQPEIFQQQFFDVFERKKYI